LSEAIALSVASKKRLSVLRSWLCILPAYVLVGTSHSFPGPKTGVSCNGSLMPSSKGKAVPLQAWSGPEGSGKLRFPDYMTTAQDGGKVVSLTHRPPLTPGNAPGTHFCWRLSRPQGHSAIGRIISMISSNNAIWNRINDLPICSTVP
jgi:hypothetical protein